MKFVVTASLALWGAMLLSGCGGGAGPPTPFNPFGTDPPGTLSEPASGSNETPSSGGQTVAQLCATVCAHIEASCPAYPSASCASGCSQAAAQFPRCMADLESFLNCAATAQLTCSGQTVAAPSCMPSELALQSCESAGTPTTVTGGAT